MAKLAADVYGEALFGLAREKEIIDGIMEELTGLGQAFSENPDFARVMEHPDIGRDEKLLVLSNVFQGRICEELLGFLKIVINKGRYSALDGIFERYTQLYKEYHRIGVAYVTSAETLLPQQKERIEKRLLQTTSFLKMEMHYEVEKALIGGIVIRIGDRVVDSSIRTKLDQLQRQLLHVQL